MHSGINGTGRWLAFAAFACLVFAGCGSSGSDGQPGSSTGTASGTVTNAMTSATLEGASVSFAPDVLGGPVTTGAGGTWSASLPAGAYVATCACPGFEDDVAGVSVQSGGAHTQDFALDPDDAVQITFSGVTNPYAPGASVMPVATAVPFDGSSILGYLWEQENSVPVVITGETTATPTVTLPGAQVYKDYLAGHVHLPGRWVPMPINPHLLEEAETVTVLCTVTTTSGEHTEAVELVAHLDFAAWATGLKNVPVGVPVLMHGVEQGSYEWELLQVPAGSTTTLQDAASRNAWFLPDAEGLYLLETWQEDGDDYTNVQVFAGEWAGAIAGVDGGGPYFEPGCVNCHSASDRWNDAYDAWRGTGHAHIFTENLNDGGHYSSNCFACHTVGYDTTADNGGMDDQDDYDDFYAAMWPGGHLTGDPGNYDEVLASWPNTARMTNIQCENCHGPNGIYMQAHNWTSPDPGGCRNCHPRISLASDVCAFCHGEPPRHARYQQWEETGHADYELAIDENRNSCQDCHTAAGYLEAYPQYLESTGIAGDRPNTSDEVVHPVTCVVCHDPHAVGTESGHGTDAPMRVEDNAYNLAAGFDAIAVGKGAQCITCHNGRRADRNSFAPKPDPGDIGRAPHGGPQADVLLGLNAYFVEIGYRGAHSFLGDTCVTCHMALTPPPAELSYNLGGTNHTFEATTEICTECHGAYDGGTLKEAFEEGLAALKEAIEREINEQFEALTNGGYEVHLTGLSDPEDEDSDVTIVVTDYSLVTDVDFGTSHGRQAMDLVYDGTPIYHVQLEDGTDIQPGGGGASEGNMFASGQWVDDPGWDLAKVGWNYLLLHNDGSYGFHHPAFATDVVIQTWVVLETMGWTLKP